MKYLKQSYPITSFIRKLVFGLLFVVMYTSALAQTNETRLTAPSGNERDFFGRSVSISADGSAAIIGADGVEDDELNDNMGSAYIFRRSDDGSWEYEDRLTAFDTVVDNYLGVSVSIDADGSTVLVGSRNDGFNINSGSAYIFSKREGMWFEDAELGDPAEEEGVSGRPVSLSDDGKVALVGITLYELNDTGEWIRANQFENDQTDNDSKFGLNTVLSADGETVLISAIGEEIGENTTNGSVYVFEKDESGDWRQQSRLTNPDGGQYDEFGRSVSINADGSVVMVGSEQDELEETAFMDSVYVFTREVSGSWSRVAELGTSGGSDEDEFGYSISLSAEGTEAVIGTYSNQSYIFKYDSTEGWKEELELDPAEKENGDLFGASVSISKNGAIVLVGAQSDNIGPENLQGSAYVFGLEINATAPAVLSESVTNVTENKAQLNARVNPNGANTEVYFEYFLSSEPENIQSISAEQNPVGGSYGQTVSATITGLESNSEYSFRVITENSEGTSAGSNITFMTKEATSIRNIRDEIPDRFTLQQNHPNPFNPATSIQYGLPVNTDVSIEIYNTVGRRVATLVENENQSAGWHEISFDASNLSSGTYIYRIQTPEFSDSKQFTLVK